MYIIICYLAKLPSSGILLIMTDLV